MVDDVPGFQTPTSPIGIVAHRATAAAFAAGETRYGELRKIYKKTWAKERTRLYRLENPLPPKSSEAIAGQRAADKLLAAGVTDKRAIEGARRIGWKEARRRKMGQKPNNRNSPPAIYARSVVDALRASGVSDKTKLRRAYRNAHGAAITPEGRIKKNRKVREVYQNNLDRERLRAKRRRHAHPNYLSDYKRKRMASDPGFHMRERLRHIVYLRLGASGRRPRTDSLVKCDSRFFKNWIQSQFKPGMTWENRKQWHIEHTFPVAACATKADLERSFFYRNLRPEWGGENSIKGCKITEAGLLSAY
jgi:hypothetical protein